ncbi:MAG: FAD-dependent oxidoreductase [Alphaproteobacteria bacterium]|nr:FAD-dependent oxidoreductase [Alphaproteobacteria bacterium]
MAVLSASGRRFETEVPVLIIGAGACGLCAALAAHGQGADVLVVERDPTPSGSTALSSGLIPAAGTKLQRRHGVEDTPAQLAEEILAKAKYQTDAAMVLTIAKASARTVDWIMDDLGVKLELLTSFLYPGHQRHRMHGPPNRTGAELEGGLLAAVERRGLDLVPGATAVDLYVEDDERVRGIAIQRPDGRREDIGCAALVLACSGFGGNADMVREYIPAIKEAMYFGHVGNKGDAVRWGLALGAAVADMASYQGHGAVAHPHGIPMWDTITVGGYQVNLRGERFSNEESGYSEQALEVLRQPDHVVWNIYDERGHAIGSESIEYRRGVELGAVRRAESVSDLARVTGLPSAALAATIAEVEAMAAGTKSDRFGRDFTLKPALKPPYYAVKVTGAVFHTQGGLVVDERARVRRRDGRPLPNLFAGGGAARGLSGPADWGYFSGSGLMMATNLGRLAGEAAAALAGRSGR